MIHFDLDILSFPKLFGVGRRAVRNGIPRLHTHDTDAMLDLQLRPRDNVIGVFILLLFEPANLCLTGLQISTNQRVTRKQL